MLVKNNVLILSNGCASYPLMKLSYCSKAGRETADETLCGFLAPGLPPVWHVGECIDNSRSSGIFAGIAAELGIKLPDMPFAFSSPEWSKTMARLPSCRPTPGCSRHRASSPPRAASRAKNGRPAEMPSPLADGAIDAYCVAEPYGAVVVAKHFGHVLATSDALWPDAICCAFVLRGDFIDAHPRAAQRIATTYRGTGSALNDREAAALSDRYLNQERSALKQSLKWIDGSHLTLTRKDYAALCGK